MRFFAVALIFFGVAASYAQTPEVPHKMHFADMTLTIRDDARREIQKDVDALTKYPKYFGIKVERARTYFPIIEKIFEEERLPTDFKYLVLQESALIADAVSVSNAVGFWQFKDFTAMEMGMRVDNQVDERKNIIAATRGAAKYLKQNNYMFNNWLYALQAYQMGAGGVKRMVGDDHNGDRHMDITTDTYWYVKKYLAHKIAFEDAVKGEAQLKMQIFPVQGKKNIGELAAELGVSEADLREHNKWILRESIPDDRQYALLVPNGKFNPDFNTLFVASKSSTNTKAVAKESTIKKEINGVMAIQARKNETLHALADRAGVSIKSFRKFNEVAANHGVKAGEFYFVQKKKNTSPTLTHTVAVGEDLWLVSQRYGVSLKRLKRLNGVTDVSDIGKGDVVWLNTKKPSSPETFSQEVAPVLVTHQTDTNYFDWEVKPAAEEKITKQKVITDVEVKQPTEESNSEIVAEERAGVHTVMQGETLYSISKKYNVQVTELLAWNNLEITNGIKPGQQLVTVNPQPFGVDDNISAQLPGENNNTWVTHEVKTTDTLYSIARQYNVTIKEIMDWNKKSDFSLAMGEKLKILPK